MSFEMNFWWGGENRIGEEMMKKQENQTRNNLLASLIENNNTERNRMMNSGNSELECQLFNLKMKCREYEQRLMQVDLHGYNGEKLQKLNMELTQELDMCKQQLQDKTEESDNLRNLVAKIADGIKALEQSNQARQSEIETLKQKLEASETKLTEKSQLCKSMQKDVEKGHKWLEMLDETKTELEKTMAELRRQEVKACQVPKLLEEQTSLKIAKSNLEKENATFRDKVVKLQEELAAMAKKMDQVEKSKEEKARDFLRSYTMKSEEKDQQHKNRCLALESTIAELRHEKKLMEDRLFKAEVESERHYTRANASENREKEQNDEIAKLKAELNNVLSREDASVKSACQELQVKFDQQMREQEEMYHEQSLRHEQALNDQREAQEKLEAQLRKQKEKEKKLIQERNMKITSLEQEVNNIKAKWKSQLSTKRRNLSIKENLSVSSNSTSVSSNSRSTPKIRCGSSAAMQQQHTTTLARKPSFR